MARTFNLQSMELDSIPLLSHNNNLEMVFVAFLLGIQDKTVGKKPLSLLAVPLGKALNGILPLLRGRQVTSRAVYTP